MADMRRIVGGAIVLVVVVGGTAACAGSGRSPARVASGAATSTSALAGSGPETTVPPKAPAGATATSPAPATTSAPRTTPRAGTTTTGPAGLSAASRLRIDGIGPVDVGMTIDQARAAAGTELVLEHEPYCDVLRAPKGPEGVSLIVSTPASGRIDLVIVNGGPVQTVSGIHAGSSEADVMATYAGRLRVVNPTLPVHRLILHGSDPAYAGRALVFVIDGSRVSTMYSGLRDQAEADEVCA